MQKTTKCQLEDKVIQKQLKDEHKQNKKKNVEN